MTYPSGPYGQGFPEQPGYGQQPGYPQQPGYGQQPGYQPQPGYPAQSGHPQPWYPGAYQPYGSAPAPSTSPSGGTAITTAVLAGLGALATLGGGILGLIGLAALNSDSTYSTSDVLSGGACALLVIVMLVNIVSGLLLLPGTVMLLQRKMIGRWLIVGGCALTILNSLLSLGLSAAVTARYESYGGGSAFEFLSLVFPIATLVLAMLPSTTAWIKARPNPVAPQFYPPYPG
ncbi:hypothetical protein [Mycolicibacterium septicum]|uniref:hypothetical protein n=1 Tax=Mycolicibacterium septicum TaxID=98668 RepID=UPI001AF0AA9D|nr:hypothetical protein [Mycolicibacterium septicum]QRY52721.1 hypothetical protein JVX95_04955 [Mycolicibacterium septicum]